MSRSELEDENWNYLLSLLPKGWEEKANTTGAVSRLRGAASLGNLLRTLFLHFAHGCSSRTTSVVAKTAGWASMSDVALLKRLRASEEWLHMLCRGLISESNMAIPATLQNMRMRLVDGTIIKEPGSGGSQWRILYSLTVPDWQCDFFRLSSAKDTGNGESLKYFDVEPNDCLVADRGFSHRDGIRDICRQGGNVIVRLNEQTTLLEDDEGLPLSLLEWLETLSEPGRIGEIQAWLPAGKTDKRWPVRLCAIRKSVESTFLAERKLKQKASRKCLNLRDETLRHAAWIVVLTTVSEKNLTAKEVLEWYRVRWQIELAFKRLKSLGGAGHVPKRDPASSRAWIYGKLLVALLTEKMQRHAASFSPWGGRWMDQDSSSKFLA